MKTKSLLFALMLIGPAAFAKASLTIDAHLQGDIYVKHHAIGKGGFDCKGGAGPTYINETSNYKYDEKKTFVSSENYGFGLQSQRPIGPMYVLQADVNINVTNEMSKISIDLSEASTKHREDGWSSGCENNHWNQYLQSSGYKGTVDFEYKVPKDVWAVKVIESPTNDVFKAEHLKSLSGALLDPNGRGERILWVQPEQTIKRSFPIDAEKNKQRGKVHYDVSFEPFGDSLSIEQVAMALNELISEADLNFVSKAKIDDMRVMLKRSFSLIRSRKNFREALKSYSTSKLDNLASKLFSIAMSEKIVIDTEVTMLLKSVSAVLSYEIAATLTDELASYCDVRTVNLPYSSKVLEVKGAHYAVFMMERLIRRLEGNSLGAYKTFFDYVASLEGERMTYAQASNNESVRKKLESAFQTVRIVARPERRPYADAYQDLVNFARVFRSIGTGAESTDAIAKNMSSLADLEDAFIRDMFVHVRQYGSTHTEPISVQNLRAQISEMQRLQAEITYQLRNHTRFLSLTGESGVDSLNAMLTRFLEHNLNILQNTIENKKFKFDFESIRAAYVDVQKIKSDNETIRKCIFNGDKK